MGVVVYSLVLTDRSYVPQGEIRSFSNFSFTRALNKLATVAFTVRLDHRFADRLSQTDGFVKVYRNNVLEFFGPIITAEEKAERNSQSISVNCADTGWILTRRLNGATVFSLQSRANIAKLIIDTNNVDHETGISTTAYALTAGSSLAINYDRMRNSLSLIQDLGAALDGFDWLFRPIENWSNGATTGVKTAGFQASTVIGTTKPNAVFEYGLGTRSNVLSYTKTRTREHQATRVFHLGGKGMSAAFGWNGPAEAIWGYHEDVIQGDFTDATIRQQLVDAHANVRGYPRDLIKMTPHIDPGVTGRLPQPFVDYDVGDTVTARFVHDGVTRFSGLLRVYGISITLDQGLERVELKLEDDS